MAFRLTRHETLSAGIPRILHEELHSAVKSLRDGSDGIHEARKSVKKLRGVLRMLEPRMGHAAKAECAALGEASRSLATARDKTATLEIIDMLAARKLSRNEARSLSALRRKMLERPVAGTTELEPAIAALTQIRGRIEEWPAMPDNFAPVLEGLRKSYRNGRKAVAVAERAPEPDNFHTLRKRVKDQWYQVRLLEGLWTEDSREPQLQELQECLGDDQNLSVLGNSTVLVPTLRGVVERTRAELRTRALELAHQLYEEKPKKHAARVLALWDSWREARKGPASAEARRARRSAAA